MQLNISFDLHPLLYDHLFLVSYFCHDQYQLSNFEARVVLYLFHSFLTLLLLSMIILNDQSKCFRINKKYLSLNKNELASSIADNLDSKQGSITNLKKIKTKGVVLLCFSYK